MEKQWHIKSISETFAELETSEYGLSNDEVSLRIKKFGKNKLPEAKLDSLAVIFLRQFQSPLIYILFAASLIVFFMGEIMDGLVILVVLMINAIIGAIQEGKAQNTISALRKFTETQATVLRDGKEVILSDLEIVPGDILIIQEGEKVPADSRIVFSHKLIVDEATLTGESFPVGKNEESVGNPNLPVTEQKNMVFKGTHIVSGNAKAVVVSTGLHTLIGKISKEILTIDTEIPLKADIRSLSNLILVLVTIIGTILFFAGILLGRPVREMFSTVVSLLVSIIPEGLPVVITLVLAAGVWRMSMRNALVKRLQAVEALGQASIIAVDKTGTITKNELMVQQIYLNGHFFDIEGMGYEPRGVIKKEGNVIDPLLHEELLLAGKISVFCANARIMFSEESKQWKVAGDPTEAAMIVFSEKIGFKKDNLDEESPEIAEIPFDYKTKYHATLHEVNGERIVALAGAPEVVIALSKKIKLKGQDVTLDDSEKRILDEAFIKMSEKGMRVVALAVGKNNSGSISPENLGQLTFLGFLGMKDTLRREINHSIKKANIAGIKVVMITGDHKVTAQAIATEAGIFHDGDKVLLGIEVDVMSDQELAENLKNVSVFARVTPEHKLRIIQAYKRNGHVVAMTGDGVNDAPSLVAADLGIAMGRIGTEVTKEASDIVLLDDNFESIVSAIEEGRNIYKTIKKVILYLFSTSIGEVLVISIALFLGLALPLLPAQIIWLNLVTDGFLTVALAMEFKEKGLLEGKFKKPSKYLIDKLMAKRMILMAIPMAFGSLILFIAYLDTGIIKALTVSLTTLAVFQWFNAWNCRSEDKSIFQMNPFSNKFLFWATLIVIGLQFLAVYNPFFNVVLRTSPLAFKDWVIIIIVSCSIIVVEELRKLFYRMSIRKK